MQSGLIVTGMVLIVLGAATVRAQRGNQENRGIADQASFWRGIKQGLTGANGGKYWEAMDHALIPGPYPVHTLRGTVVSSKPAEHPSQLVVAMSDDHTPEVTLKLFDEQGKVAGIKKPVPPGTIVEFGGIAMKFEHEPFMLTFAVELGLDPDDGLWIFRKDNEKERQK
jgi:hypothetical protein